MGLAVADVVGRDTRVAVWRPGDELTEINEAEPPAEILRDVALAFKLQQQPDEPPSPQPRPPQRQRARPVVAGVCRALATGHQLVSQAGACDETGPTAGSRRSGWGAACPVLFVPEAVQGLRFGAEPLDAVAGYLGSHGVQARCSVQAVRAIPFAKPMRVPKVVAASIAELLLLQAAEANADLIVMGGYGHSRAEELVLGGVIRSMLALMTVPLLMPYGASIGARCRR